MPKTLDGASPCDAFLDWLFGKRRRSGGITLAVEAPVFGNDNAEADDRLQDCYVDVHVPEYCTVFTARWGAGKTAVLLRRGQELNEVLASATGRDSVDSWFIRESAIGLHQLHSLRSLTAGDSARMEKSLEAVWRAEIARRIALQLDDLFQLCGSPLGDHWSSVLEFAEDARHRDSYLMRVDDAARHIELIGKSPVPPPEDLESLDRAFGEDLLSALALCVSDIPEGVPTPLVAVEPIETPHSGIEGTGGLAQPLVNALLNLFVDEFQPSRRQPLDVLIAIPWHRYRPRELHHPQKLRQYAGHISWTPDLLREFISNRIAWELEKRFKRTPSLKGGADLFSVTFEPSITNTNTATPVTEDSFHYFLRHTHYRPRDLLRLARRAVEVQVQLSSESVDGVLAGVLSKRKPISAKAIKAAVNQVCADNADEFLDEVSRRHPYLDEHFFRQLHGMAVPFDTEVLHKRLSRLDEPPEVNALLADLWESGVVGVEMRPATPGWIAHLMAAYGNENHRSYKIREGRRQHEEHRWYFYSHNTGRQLKDLVTETEGADISLVLHPSLIESFAPEFNRVCPLGV